MKNEELSIGFEFIPEHYAGNYPFITIHRKLSQKQEAEEIARIIYEAWRKEKGYE